MRHESMNDCINQGCNSMQKNFENIGKVGIGMQIFRSRGRFLCVSWFFLKINL